MVNPGTYMVVSAACAGAVICHAFHTRRQFYPVMLYLSHSKISLLFLLNMGFVIMCVLWQLVNMIFLGPLRETEVERLNEQVWREIMEILFAMTVFRDEFNIQFLFLITVLMFVKAYHWLAQKRVEYIETTPSLPHLSHVRLCTFMALLLTLDCLFFHRSLSHLLKTREASVSLFFAFEYSILVSTMIGIFIKYGLHMAETYMDGRFNSKAVCLFYLELVQDLLHLSLYLLFFLVIFMHYGLPLHLVRELYETFRNFKNRIADYIRYRKLTSNMNERFADATAEDINHDATCIVCREDMVEAKKLPCGHLFHVYCLRQWLERQNTCPTCRAPVLAEDEPSAELEDQRFEDELPGEEGIGDFALDNDNDPGNDDVTVTPAVAPDTDWPQMQAAANRAASNYGTSFVLPALSHGYAIWCPMLIPYPPQVQPPTLGTSEVFGEGEGHHTSGNLRSNTVAGPIPMIIAAQSQHGIAQRWIWKHAIAQTAEILCQLQQNALQPWTSPGALSSADSNFASPKSLLSRMIRCQGQEYSQDQSQLSARCAQLNYLRGVSEILRNHLQLSIELQRQVSLMSEGQRLSEAEASQGTEPLVRQESSDIRRPSEDSEIQSQVNQVEVIDEQIGPPSISTNPLYNLSELSSSCSSTSRAETS